MADHPFRRIDAKTVYSNPWIDLEEHTLEVRATGKQFFYTYLASAPSVMVVGLTPQGTIPIVREYRYPTRSFCYELPGGGSRGFDSLEDAARAELAQETGWRAGAVQDLGQFAVYSGLSDEMCHVYLATDLARGEPQLDATESIEALEVTPQALRSMIESGQFRDGMSLAALGILQPRLDGLTT